MIVFMLGVLGILGVGFFLIYLVNRAFQDVEDNIEERW